MELAGDASALVLLRLQQAMRDLGVGEAFLFAMHQKGCLAAGLERKKRGGELLDEAARHLVERAHEPRGADEYHAKIPVFHQRKREEARQRLGNDDGVLKQLALGDVVFDAVHHDAAAQLLNLAQRPHALGKMDEGVVLGGAARRVLPGEDGRRAVGDNGDAHEVQPEAIAHILSRLRSARVKLPDEFPPIALFHLDPLDETPRTRSRWGAPRRLLPPRTPRCPRCGGAG